MFGAEMMRVGLWGLRYFIFLMVNCYAMGIILEG